MADGRGSILVFFFAFAALVVATHISYLRTPFFWDEAGQYVPVALDLYRDGAWIPHSALVLLHPPALAALLALVWHATGFSIPATRLAMLLIASLGVLFSFLLAIRLGRGAVGAPAFAAVLLLLATPLFFTQAMMVQLDMPVMALTALALLLFLGDRFVLCALVCTAAVMTKETAITTPLVFALWLWFAGRRWREALYFIAPALALGAWMLLLHRATGHWLGDPVYSHANLIAPLEPAHLLAAIARRAYYLFIADGRWLGSVALYAGWRTLVGKDWTLAGLVALAQVAVVTIFGGATLERYLLPALPIFYAAIAVAASAYPASWRWTSHTLLIGALFLGWFWDPPYPFPLENNLAMMDAIGLHKQAAEFLERGHGRRIATAWPLSDEIARPDLGYVEHPLPVSRIPGFALKQLASFDAAATDVLVVYARTPPLEGWPFADAVRSFLPHSLAVASDEQIRAGLGFVPVARLARGSQWLEIYIREQ